MNAFELILNLVGTLATLGAALAAACALWTWRTRLVAERQASVAMEALTDAYAYQDFFNAARDPSGAANTQAERDRQHDPEGQTDRLDAYHAVQALLRSQPEFVGRLKVAEYRLRASFGNETAAEAIRGIWLVRSHALGTLNTLAPNGKAG